MKITILGAGNAGCSSALHYFYHKLELNYKVELELIYDPKIKPVPTGQGTTLDLPKLLSTSLLVNYFNNFPITIKTGIMYENWGKTKKHFHGFTVGDFGIHFNPEDFQNFVCKNLPIKIKTSKVIDYNSIDSDFIIDCRGAPKDLKEYEPLVNPLNCALLGTLDKKEDDVLWTRTIATKDGWCFYIPLPDKTSVGYLYNSSITKEKEAKINFKKLFNKIKINQTFPFRQYLAKEPIVDNRVLLNGNKLFFLEPLEATAMSGYLATCRFYWDYMFNNVPKKITTNLIKDYVYKTQNFILWHYKNGSKFNTNFWIYAKELWQKHNPQDINHIKMLLKSMNEESLQKSFKNSNIQYAQWTEWSLLNWYNKMDRHYEH